MNLRTDMAIECHENLNVNHSSGVTVENEKYEDVEITRVKIISPEGEKTMGKPMGEYITVDLPEFSHESELLDSRLDILKSLIRDLIPKNAKSFLVAGLGNENITPDALGPICAEKVFSTRHFESIAESELNLPKVNAVSSISTGVLGQTGIETAEYINGISSFINPDVVIIVDALASSKLSSLGKTVQISNTGITPGSGVGNYRKTIDKSTLGVPVISIGVPLVVDLEQDRTMFVTPKEIDNIVSRAAGLIAMSINCALQPNFTPEMFLALS